MEPDGPCCDWSRLLNDCFEATLGSLHPADPAACRQVCRAWHTLVSLALARLCPSPSADLGNLGNLFPALRELELTATAGALSQLPSLCALSSLQQLTLAAGRPNATAGHSLRQPLDCAADLAPLLRIPSLRGLALRGFRLSSVTELRRLGGLQRLSMSEVDIDLDPSKDGSERGGLAAALVHWTALQHLTVSGRIVGAPGAELLSGLSQLGSLRSLELGGALGLSDEVCKEVSALPRLRSVSLLNQLCWELGPPNPVVTDAGVESIAQGALLSSLTQLVLRGHSGITACAALAAIRGVEGLQALDLGLSGNLNGAQPPQPAPRSSDSAPLHHLRALRRRSLALAGCQVDDAGCHVIATLPYISRLELHGCAALTDGGVVHLAAVPLRHLALRSCTAVTDIGLAELARRAHGLTFLDLSGCYRNVTATGVAALAALPRLRALSLAHCEAVTDAALEALLPRNRQLERLDCSDCNVTDRACALVAACAPVMRALALQHCPQVTDSGVRLLGRLRQLEELKLFGTRATAGGVEAMLGASSLRGGRRLVVSMAMESWWKAA